MRAETSATSAITALSVAVAALGHALAGGSVSLTALPQLVVLAAVGWSLGEHLSGRRHLTLGFLATLQLTTHLTLDANHPTAPTATDPAVTSHAAGLGPTADAATATHHAAVGHAVQAADHATLGHVVQAADHAATADHTTLAHAATADHSALAHAAAADHSAVGHGAVDGVAGMDAASASVSGVGEAGVGSMGGMHDGVFGAVGMSVAHLVVLLAGVLLVGSTHRWVQRVLGILARLAPQLPVPAVAIPGVRAALLGVPEQPRLTQRWLTSGVSRRGPPQYRVLAALY
ncbi:hypothetical protein [Kribbella sp. NPDC023855]|uniref:hypothetical protein n=1 Tax=Kribbella sp. NPDC023855 TaxID=3154698 RepID=UPI0033FCBE33